MSQTTWSSSRLSETSRGVHAVTPPLKHRRSGWRQVLVDVERGIALGLRLDCSYPTYFFAATFVIMLGFAVGISPVEWAILIVSLAMVLSAQMFHQMFRILSQQQEFQLSSAIKSLVRMATAAVSVAIIGAGTAICIIFWQRLVILL